MASSEICRHFGRPRISWRNVLVRCIAREKALLANDDARQMVLVQGCLELCPLTAEGSKQGSIDSTSDITMLPEPGMVVAGEDVTVKMASQAKGPYPTFLSDNPVGGEGPGAGNSHLFMQDVEKEEITHQSFSSDSILSACIDNLARDFETVQIEDRNRRIDRAVSGVSEVLKVLSKFGVKSRPTPYLPLELRLHSDEIFCKNLFLKDRRNQYYLVICDENKDLDLKTLRRKLKAYRNFSFATPNEMAAILKIRPGGVTPFAIMHESARDVRVVMTTDLTEDSQSLLNFHPMNEKLTLAVKLQDLEKFLHHFRFDLEFVEMSE